MPQCICSNQVTIGDNGVIQVSFDSTPAQIRSDGMMFGEPIRGEAKMIDSGWYLLMTDAMSEWFINRLNEQRDVASMLFKLGGNEEFEQLIEKEYQSGRMRSDDCTVVLIRIAENTPKENEWDDFPDEECFVPHQRNFVQRSLLWLKKHLEKSSTLSNNEQINDNKQNSDNDD
jgi:hypothetical protein